MKPIITSFLDTDLYEFTMGQAHWWNKRNQHCKMEFICRDKNFKFTPELVNKIREQIWMLKDLKFTEEELIYLGGYKFISSGYINWLRDEFKFNPDKEITCHLDGERLVLSAYGSIRIVPHYEVYCLAIINELCMAENRIFGLGNKLSGEHYGKAILTHKIEMLRDAENPKIKFAEFGTRRRFSKAWQDYVVEELAAMNKLYPNSVQLVGTSNIYLAMKHGINPIGTQAHKYFQAHQAFAGYCLQDFQYNALCEWRSTYGPHLNVALTDTVGIGAFLNDLKRGYYGKPMFELYSGFRHDSGDPYTWGENILTFLRNRMVEKPTLLFSDGLDISKCFKLQEHFGDRANVMFAIGTNLTNDVGANPLSIVMKMTECDGKPVAKLSDEKGKYTGNVEMIKKLQDTFGVC